MLKLVSWKTLDYLPYFNSCASNLGLSWWSHDIGGFKEGIEDAELYMRYVQFGTFSPIFRFSAKRGIYYKREPWRWDITTSSETNAEIVNISLVFPKQYDKYAKS